MKNDIINLKEIINLIEDNIENYTGEDKEKLEEIKKVFETRRQKIPDEYYDAKKRILEEKELKYDESDSIENRLKKRLSDERKNFEKVFFKLENRVKYLVGYKEDIKTQGINEFLYKLIDIRDRGNNDENIILYLSAKMYSNKAVNQFMYYYIEKKSKGLNTTGFSDMVLGAFLELDPLHKEVEKSQVQKLNIDNFLKIKLESNLEKYLKDTFYYLKKNLCNDSFTLKIRTENIIFSNDELENTTIFFKETYPKAESIKWSFYLYLEFFSIVEPQNIKKMLFKLRLKKNNILEIIENKKKTILFNQANIDGQESINNITEEEKKLNIEELRNVSKENFISLLEKYKLTFLKKRSAIESIGTSLSIGLIDWLKLNDFISELKFYLEIIERVSNTSKIDIEKIIKKKNNISPNFDSFYKKISYIDEKFENSSFNNKSHNFIIQKPKISINRREFFKEYTKLYKDYEVFLEIKFMKIKLYFISNYKSKDYFTEFKALIEAYIKILETAQKNHDGSIAFSREIIINELIKDLDL